MISREAERTMGASPPRLRQQHVAFKWPAVSAFLMAFFRTRRLQKIKACLTEFIMGTGRCAYNQNGVDLKNLTIKTHRRTYKQDVLSDS